MRALKIAAVAACVLSGAVAATSPASLTVVVFDYASTPHRLFTSAVDESRRAFHAAGVATEWIFCNPEQSCYVPEQFVQVKILSHVLKSLPVSRHGLGASIPCSITAHCAASYVFLDRVVTFGGHTGSPLDVAMGYVMAHEIGHLMGLGHRPGGIMTPDLTARDLNRAALGWLNFADDDARALREAVMHIQLVGVPVRRVKVSLSRGDITE